MTAATKPPPRPSREPLLALQALRFVAAALVLVHHTGFDADLLAARTGRPPLLLDHWFDWSFGIHLFFVLSGFIMVTVERDFGRPGAAGRFVLRRMIRVVPLYWLLTTALLASAAVAPGLLNTPVEGWRHTLGSYLFIPVMRTSGDSHPVLGQGWTLNYEMLFYCVFAAAMVAPRRIGLAAVALTLLALVALGRAFAPSAAAPQVWTDPLLLEFLFGGAVALLRDAGLACGRAPALVLVGAGVAVALATGSVFAVATGPVWLTEGGAAALVLAGLALGPPWAPTRIVLALSLLGDASYSLYLSHPFVIRPLREVWQMLIPRGLPAAYVILAGLAAIAAALMLHLLVERPITQRLRRAMQMGGASRALVSTKPRIGEPDRLYQP